MAEILSKLGGIENAGIKNGLTKITRYGHDASFSEVLKARLEQQAGVKFSSHALDRLNERGITLEHNDLQRLSDAVSRMTGHL